MVTSPKQYRESPHQQKQQGKREERKTRNETQWEGHSSGGILHVFLSQSTPVQYVFCDSKHSFHQRGIQHLTESFSYVCSVHTGDMNIGLGLDCLTFGENWGGHSS